MNDETIDEVVFFCWSLFNSNFDLIIRDNFKIKPNKKIGTTKFLLRRC